MIVQQRDLVSALQAGASVWNTWRRALKLKRPDFSGADLSNLDLRGTNLRSANLEGADLRGSDFSGATLTNARMAGCIASDANFTRARMGRADLTGADCRRARFDRASLRGARFARALLDAATLDGADLAGAHGIEGAGPDRSESAAPPFRLPDDFYRDIAADISDSPVVDGEQESVHRVRHFREALTRPPMEAEERLSIAPPSPDRYTVHFGTNRAPLDPSDIQKGFGSGRGAQVIYGTASVIIPESRRVGEIEAGWWRRIVGAVTGTRTGMELERLSLLTQEIFWTQVENILAEVPETARDAVVFLHGYNNTFHNAVLRAAQIGCDLKLPLMGMFSWPSQGDLKGYPADEAAIEASEWAIAEFLANMALRTPSRRVHVFAHSMGNRGVLRSLTRIIHVAGRFGQFVLAAPDVDRDLFLQHAGGFRDFALRTTVYASDFDIAVGASRYLRQFPRVGFIPPVTVAAGVDTIHVPKIDLTLLGHGYAAEVRSVLTDIGELVRHNTSPDRRIGLRRVTQPDGDYWRFGR